MSSSYMFPVIVDGVKNPIKPLERDNKRGVKEFEIVLDKNYDK